MKRGRLTWLCSTLFAGLLAMSWAGGAWGDCMGPNPVPGEKPPWAGTVCTDDVIELLEEKGECGTGMCGTGERHQYGHEDDLLLEEGQCGTGMCGTGERHQYGQD